MNTMLSILRLMPHGFFNTTTDCAEFELNIANHQNADQPVYVSPPAPIRCIPSQIGRVFKNPNTLRTSRFNIKTITSIVVDLLSCIADMLQFSEGIHANHRILFMNTIEALVYQRMAGILAYFAICSITGIDIIAGILMPWNALQDTLIIQMHYNS
jgi:hypothetical protein